MKGFFILRLVDGIDMGLRERVDIFFRVVVMDQWCCFRGRHFGEPESEMLTNIRIPDSNKRNIYAIYEPINEYKKKVRSKVI